MKFGIYIQKLVRKHIILILNSINIHSTNFRKHDLTK